MDSVHIRDATPRDVDSIIAIARQTWWPVYGEIVPQDQNEYMLDRLYNKTVLTEAILTGTQRFIMLDRDGKPEAFASYSQRENMPGVYKLHKLYVLPQGHGKGNGAALIREIQARLRADGIHVLDLNVNRQNKAKFFYEKMGFKVVAQEDVPIGPYFMNDFVMRSEF